MLLCWCFPGFPEQGNALFSAQMATFIEKMLALLETYLLTQNLYLFENNAAFAITKCSSLCNISTRAFNYYFKNYRFLSTPNYRAITHPCLSDWLIWVIVLTKAELIWQFYKAKLSKTASNVELLNSKLWFAHAEIINTCKKCSSMHDHLTHENKLGLYHPEIRGQNNAS